MFFIHIGQKKTGTTSLQNFFAKNAVALDAAGVCYTELRRGNTHHTLAQSFVKQRPELAHLPGELKKLAQDFPNRHFLFSSEIFSRLPAEAIERLAELLKPHEVRILAYVRNFADQKVSFYNQRTKSGANILDFDEFFDHERFVRNGYENIGKWSRVFGKDNVRVAALDALTGENALFRDALAAIGLSFDRLHPIDPDSLVARNVAYGWKVTEVFRMLSAQLWPREQVRPDRRLVKRRPHKRVVLGECERIASEFGFARDRTPYLTKKQADQLRSEYVEAIDKLRDFVCEPVVIGEWKEAEERPFLPSIERIPAAERQAFAEALAGSKLRKRLPGLEKAISRLA